MPKNGNMQRPDAQSTKISILEEIKVLHDIKNICDELNNLKSLVEAQEGVWKQAFEIEKLENGAHFAHKHTLALSTVKARLEAMLHNAHEVQTSACGCEVTLVSYIADIKHE
jgi:hypothetical protein